MVSQIQKAKKRRREMRTNGRPTTVTKSTRIFFFSKSFSFLFFRLYLNYKWMKNHIANTSKYHATYPEVNTDGTKKKQRRNKNEKKKIITKSSCRNRNVSKLYSVLIYEVLFISFFSALDTFNMHVKKFFHFFFHLPFCLRLFFAPFDRLIFFLSGLLFLSSHA